LGKSKDKIGAPLERHMSVPQSMRSKDSLKNVPATSAGTDLGNGDCHWRRLSAGGYIRFHHFSWIDDTIEFGVGDKA
jgi:hypothetical protein